MRKHIKKLLCSSLIAIMSIGCFNTEARVTKEVAEATLPYLMEAAGIPGDPHSGTTKRANASEYENNKIQTILGIIYTDAGQREMVDWAQNGVFPPALTAAGFQSTGKYTNDNYRKYSLSSLFPCNTKTFTSFANNDTRLGKYLLADVKKQKEICIRLLKFKAIESIKKPDDIMYNLSDPHSIDCQLAKIIFILDIFDSADQIRDLINNLFNPQGGNQFNVKNENEYTCRPVPATVAEKAGDCIETLYRHLINISIQDPNNLNKLHIERLPVQLQKYYDKKLSYTQKQTFDGFEIRGCSESGMTNIQGHETWKKNLREVISTNLDISSGSIINIAKVLDYIAFFNENRNTSLIRADDISGLSTLLQNALNKLAALNNSSQPRFIVNINTNAATLDWANKEIVIQDKHAHRTITVSICEKPHDNYGHAEITGITF